MEWMVTVNPMSYPYHWLKIKVSGHKICKFRGFRWRKSNNTAESRWLQEEDRELGAYPCFNIDSLSPTSDNQSVNKKRISSARPLELEKIFLVASEATFLTSQLGWQSRYISSCTKGQWINTCYSPYKYFSSSKLNVRINILKDFQIRKTRFNNLEHSSQLYVPAAMTGSKNILEPCNSKYELSWAQERKVPVYTQNPIYRGEC